MELPHQAWEEDNWNLIWILDETNIYLIGLMGGFWLYR